MQKLAFRQVEMVYFNNTCCQRINSKNISIYEVNSEHKNMLSLQSLKSSFFIFLLNICKVTFNCIKMASIMSDRIENVYQQRYKSTKIIIMRKRCFLEPIKKPLNNTSRIIFQLYFHKCDDLECFFFGTSLKICEFPLRTILKRYLNFLMYFEETSNCIFVDSRCKNYMNG